MESGRINSTKRAAKRARTPPSLFGIERRMAYTQRKYHSGLIWIGVTKGFAIRKFSGSVRRLGINKIIIMNRESVIEYPRASLVE